jgi:hypothetical protein
MLIVKVRSHCNSHSEESRQKSPENDRMILHDHTDRNNRSTRC